MLLGALQQQWLRQGHARQLPGHRCSKPHDGWHLPASPLKHSVALGVQSQQQQQQQSQHSGATHERGPTTTSGGLGNHVSTRRAISAVLYRLLRGSKDHGITIKC